jgi:dihydrofolate synthase / folylpolyglutamate synthase
MLHKKIISPALFISLRMDYQDTLQWMFSRLPMYQRIGGAAYKASLDNTIRLLDLLQNPHKNFKSVHIAGTNGKGSVSHMLAAVLQEAGYKTGLYTSPHLKDFRERIRINGAMISPESVVDFIAKFQPDFESMELSFFEMTVGMAFSHFAKEQVDIAIVETGMGGRLDSTNLVEPLLSIITNIGYDHMQFLGDTLEKIAIEKAGIIKKNIPVIIGETQPLLQPIFEQKASQMKSPIHYADQIFEARRLESEAGLCQHFDIWKNYEPYLEKLEVGLNGHYQQKNVITAICAIDLLHSHYKIEEKHIRYGLSEVRAMTGLNGRWQQLGRNPEVIADAAHNINGISEVVKQIMQMNFAHLHVVFGMVNDKNCEEILQHLPRGATYYFCKADIPRAMDAATLAAKGFEMGLRGEVYNSVGDAYRSALNNAHFNDMVFVGGSTFVVAEVV